MSVNPTLTMEELKAFWKEGWEAAKDKMVKKVTNPEVQRTWHKHAMSPSAERNYAIETQAAIKARRRAKRIEETQPHEWGDGAAEGIEAKLLTATEQDRWAVRAGPYVMLVHEIRTLYRETGLSGIAGGEWWLKNVSARLKLAKKNPELIPKIRAEILAALRRVAPPVVAPARVPAR